MDYVSINKRRVQRGAYIKEMDERSHIPLDVLLDLTDDLIILWPVCLGLYSLVFQELTEPAELALARTIVRMA